MVRVAWVKLAEARGRRPLASINLTHANLSKIAKKTSKKEVKEVSSLQVPNRGTLSPAGFGEGMVPDQGDKLG